MKATGIVRRIDDLGRVVIPKEIRRTLRIREGDPMEIYTDREGKIILKKYSPLGEMGNFAQSYVESLAQITRFLVCITDTEQVLAAAGPGKREFAEQPITRQLREAIVRRENFQAQSGEKRFLKVSPEQEDGYLSQVVCPVISEGDAIGAVVIQTKEGKGSISEMERKLAACAALFLGKQMEQ